MKVFNLYGNASGAKINEQKQEIMCIGSGCLSNDVQNDHDISIKNMLWKYLEYIFAKTKKNVKHWTGKIKYKRLYKHLICGNKDNKQFKKSSCDQQLTYVKIVVYLVCYIYV